MAYTPINTTAYTTAYAGAVAGMGVSGWISDPTNTNYSNQTIIAGAFAQAFDQAWNNAAQLNNLEIAAISEITQAEFSGRGPGALANPLFANPSNWNIAARACIALVLQSDIYFATQGINPGTPGGGFTPPSGTGFVHVTGGIVDPVAALINLTSDVTGVLPFSNYQSPTGTGFFKIASGAQVMAAGAVNLASSDVTGILAPTNGGAGASGTGFLHITGGSVDAASRAVNLASVDVTGILPFANYQSPTGTGFFKITGGAQAGAAAAVNLASADVTGVLPPANGGAGATGTGFLHITAGAVDAASKLVDLASSDVTGVLPFAKYQSPTGTGFFKVSAGAQVGAAAAVNLASADVTGVLPFANYQSPTGTGFFKVSAGAQVAAAAAVNLASADVTGVLPFANYQSPTGTGFFKISGGAQVAAAAAVNLASSDVSGILPSPNGGGTFLQTTWQNVASGATLNLAGGATTSFITVNGTAAVANVINLPASGSAVDGQVVVISIVSSTPGGSQQIPKLTINPGAGNQLMDPGGTVVFTTGTGTTPAQAGIFMYKYRSATVTPFTAPGWVGFGAFGG